MASALENYVNVVRTLSASGNFDVLVEHLNDSIELLTKNSNILDNVLETLDIQQHSLGVLYVLLAKFSNALGRLTRKASHAHSLSQRPFEFLNFDEVLNREIYNGLNPPPNIAYEWNNSQNITADAAHLIRLFKDFITLCNGEQVRFASHSYYELCHLFTSFIVRQPSCIHGIKILAHAVDKIRLFDSQLTAVHADLCLLSLQAKCFKTALKFLDIDITSIATDGSSSRGSFFASLQDSNHDAKYFLLYYYYGGMIYTAIKNYDRALYFFEVAVSTPAMAMSHIMLESYKKFILVSLILHGKILTIPKYSSQVVSRFMKPLSQGYHELATAYVSSSSDELRTVVIKYSEVFVRDINMGLVKQVQSSLYKKNIQRLTKTFLTLSLPDVASRVQLATAAEAEKYILHMIKAGEIYATINQKDGMVVFKDDPEKYNTPEMFLKVQDDMTGVMELLKQINKMEEEIVLNPMYVKKAIGNQEDEIASGQHSKTYSGDPTE